MGSLRFDGVLFVAYSSDHAPRHVHGFCGDIEVIVDLLADGKTAIALRKDAVRPAAAKRSDVKKILRAAMDHFDELARLWKEIHG